MPIQQSTTSIKSILLVFLEVFETEAYGYTKPEFYVTSLSKDC